MRGDLATEPVLATMRRARERQESVSRWLSLLAPALLVLFVVSACVDPAPGLTGAHLVVTIAVVAFIPAVFGRNATAERAGILHAACIAVLFASSVALMWVQPDGPGSAGVLLATLCVARFLPIRVGVPVFVVGFVALEVITALTGHGYAAVAVLAALGALYGMLYLSFRLAGANRQAAHLVTELERGQQARAEATALAERQRLAREMHDVLAHSLSGLMLQLEGARMLAAEDPTDPRLPDAIDRAHHLGRAGLDEARRAIGMLRGDDLPGPERLAGLAEQFERDSGIPCRLVVTGQPYDLGSEARVALYRVAQEALTNITKHARPERVELRLAYEPSGTRLTVEDATTGPCADATPTSSGYGLTGMRERAELLGGTLRAAATGTGFRVELEVPA